MADQEAARRRYEADLSTTRGALRELLRAEPSDAHPGLGTVVFASALAGLLVRPATGALVAGAFAALFLLTLTVVHPRGVRGRDAGRRTCLFTSGWARWLQ
ncbi:hypothetical protein [Streptomyces griseoruber]|uniref:hypothetical protein n=1 Tax=Streptomyces griseoruber TaxID=1943 RepID=UPI000D14DC37|nr:hypothetical protein [Streptomyces griseoruber]